MTSTKSLYLGATVAMPLLLAAVSVGTTHGRGTPAIVAAENDIAGVVTGPNGPEAGVWVIAETTELPTKFVKIVVTDDRGRYVIPELPKANYSVWVRGYGLVDSPKRRAAPGATVNLTAVVAPNAQAAAQYYPAGYWYSLVRIPPKTDFPGTGPEGNGLAPSLTSQAQLLRTIKSGGCTACHQLGTIGTRQFPPSLGKFSSSTAAWDRRVQSGQAGAGMSATLDQLGRQRMLAMFADWTDRIANGEVPAAPRRPQGIERNVVITQWDWADQKRISTTSSRPTAASRPSTRTASCMARSSSAPTTSPCSTHGATRRARCR
jgi:hypothetical protein